jgi:tripartite-type tricarboxylate transporter receptor subunit TctC
MVAATHKGGRRMLAKTLLGALLLTLAVTIAPQPAASYPTKPVRMVVVYGPGSGPDIAIRIYANYLQKKTGQPFVVENKLGAGGIVAIEEVHKSPADGYTILVGDVSANAFIPALSARKVSFDMSKGLAPVTLISEAKTLLLATTTRFPPTTIKEMVDWSKANGPVIAASGGIGTYNHLDMVALAKAAGFALKHIPFSNLAESTAFMAKGDIHAQMLTFATAEVRMSAGQARIIAVAGNTRNPRAPDYPSYGELGLPTGTISWQGLFLPGGTPKDVVDEVFKLFNAAGQDEQIVAALDKAKLDIRRSDSPAQFADYIRSEMKRVANTAQENGVRVP